MKSSSSFLKKCYVWLAFVLIKSFWELSLIQSTNQSVHIANIGPLKQKSVHNSVNRNAFSLYMLELFVRCCFLVHY